MVWTLRAKNTEKLLVGNQIDVSSSSRSSSSFFPSQNDQVCKSVEVAADRPYDYVILTTKVTLSPMYTPAGTNPTKAVPDLIKTSAILAPLLSSPYIDKYSQPAYVLLQNGLNVEVDLYHAIKALGKDEPKIVGTSLYIGTNLLAPDLVDHNSFVGIFNLSLRPRFTSQPLHRIDQPLECIDIMTLLLQ